MSKRVTQTAEGGNRVRQPINGNSVVVQHFSKDIARATPNQKYMKANGEIGVGLGISPHTEEIESNGNAVHSNLSSALKGPKTG